MACLYSSLDILAEVVRRFLLHALRSKALKSIIVGKMRDQMIANTSSDISNDQLKLAAPILVPAQYAAGPPKPPNSAASRSLSLNHERLWWIVMASPSQMISSQKGIGQPGFLNVKNPTCCRVPSTSRPRNIRNQIIFRSSSLCSEVVRRMRRIRHPATAPRLPHSIAENQTA